MGEAIISTIFSVKYVLFLSTLARCDFCNGKRFDEGLRIIRPCEKIFGVKYLPFLFNICTPKCYNLFKKSQI